MVALKKLHHLALRCKDARKTVEFYTEVFDVTLVAAETSDIVPSTGEFSPHCNLFMQMADGSLLDFIDVPLAPPQGRDENTPPWVQHFAFEVESLDKLGEIKKRVEAKGIKVLGPADHGFCQSIYFFDPSGHRLEVTWPNDPGYLKKSVLTANDKLAAWENKKKQGWTIPQKAAQPS
jgi:glyoxylase I family protein